MISLPEGFAELDPNNRWLVETRLQLIEEVACGPQACGIGAPDMEEAEKRIRQAVERRDRKAEEDAIVDCMRAEVREGWQDFPKRELLTGLYRRAARRRAGCGSTDSRHTPSHQQGLQVARPLLTPVPGHETVGLRVGVRSRVESSDRPMAVSQRTTRPPRVASVHQAIPIQPGLLRRSRALMGGTGQPGADHPQLASQVAAEGYQRGPNASREEASPTPSPRQFGPRQA